MSTAMIATAVAATAIGLGGGRVSATAPSDFADEGEEFITEPDGEVAAALGITFSEAECTEPAEVVIGSLYTCTALGSDGEPWVFTLEIDGEASFQITDGTPFDPGDELTAPQLDQLVRSFVRAIGADSTELGPFACSVTEEQVTCFGVSDGEVIVGTAPWRGSAPEAWTTVRYTPADGASAPTTPATTATTASVSDVSAQD